MPMKSKTQADQLVILPQADPKNDANVKLPDDVRHSAAVAEALSTGKPVPPARQSKQLRSGRIKYTDAQIDQVLQDWDRGALKPTDPRLGLIRDLAGEGARQIKARRRGAGEPRKKSDYVTRRLEAVLQAYRELSKTRQKTPTGAKTVDALRQSVIQILGVQDDDDAVSEETIKKDVQQLSPVFRLVRQGIIPGVGKPSPQPTISEKTRQEMEAGAKALARAAAAKSKARRPQKKKPK